MGCGKSKLDVVSSAITSKRSNGSKRSSKDGESVAVGKNTTENNVGAVEESAGESELVQEQVVEEREDVAETKLVEHEDRIQNPMEEDNAAEEAVGDSHVDGIKEDGAVAVVEDQQEQPERLISKDADAKSEYETPTVLSEKEGPTVLSEKEGLLHDQNAKLDVDVVPAESNKTVVGEKKQEPENGESVVGKEEDAVKEGKTDAAVAPEVARQTEKKIVQ